jgi:probable rRNA maturation factor
MDKRSSAEIEVDIQIAPAFVALVSEDRLRAAAEAAMRQERAGGGVTLVITDDRGIQDLNRDFLGIDAPTDVLAFGAREGDEPFVVAPEAEDYWGDIILSYPRADAQAQEMGHPVEFELQLLIVHGVLHLLGYDHAEEEEKALMWAEQEAILDDLRS